MGVTPETTPASAAEAPVGNVVIIAGAGPLPRRLANAAANNGWSVAIAAVEGCADDDFTGYDTCSFGFLEIAAFRSFLLARDKPVVVFSGRFPRPRIRDLRMDLGIFRAALDVMQARTGSDERATAVVAGIFRKHGVEVVSPSVIAPELVAEAGVLTRAAPSAEARQDIEAGFEAMAELAPLQIGQALVVHRRRIIAVEAAEGTDAMIRRCQTLREEGRFRAPEPAGVVVKAPKSTTDLRMDMPVVGLITVENAISARLAGVAVEAGGVLMPERDNVIARADEAGLFVVGIAPDKMDRAHG